MDFEANAKDGIAVDWPIRYNEIAPWYDYVEKFAGISGNKDGLAAITRWHFLPPMELNCVEKDVAARMKEHYKGQRIDHIGRVANITVPHQGRTNCQYRNKCWLGCPFGAYFSTQSSTLPAAMKTGNLTLRPFSIVTKVLYDKDTKKSNRCRSTGCRNQYKRTSTNQKLFFSVLLHSILPGSYSILQQISGPVDWEAAVVNWVIM